MGQLPAIEVGSVWLIDDRTVRLVRVTPFVVEIEPLEGNLDRRVLPLALFRAQATLLP